MLWIKRNLGLVLGGVIALALMGVAGFYLYQQIQANEEMTQKWQSTLDQLRRLENRNPHPNQDNIEAAQQDFQRVEAFQQRTKEVFSSLNYPTVTNALEFRKLLGRSLFDLQRQAQMNGVDVPTNYNFSFTAQLQAPSIQQDSLEPLAHQLTEVKAICNVIYAAKVHRLGEIRRAQVAPSDLQGTIEDYIGKQVATNEMTLVFPYQVSFQGFTKELSHVLDGFIDATPCFIVKNVQVQNTGSGDLGTRSPYGGNYGDPYGRRGEYGSSSPGAASSYTERYGITPNQRSGEYGGAMDRYGRGGSDPYGRGRDGYGGRYGGRYGRSQYGGQYTQPVQPSAPSGPTPGLYPYLDEDLLRVTLLVEVAKLKPETKPDTPQTSL